MACAVVPLVMVLGACQPADVINQIAASVNPAITPTTATPTTAPPAPTTITPTTTTPDPVLSTTPPSLCDRPKLDGPTTPPLGAVRIDPGTSAASVTAAHGAGTTFWFAPGRHIVASPITVNTGDTFLGAPGAILDGGFLNTTAFTGGGANATIAHLVIEQFGTVAGTGSVNSSPINRSVASGWHLHHNTIRRNDGNAVFLGANSITDQNCISENGQTGLAAPAQRRNGTYVSLDGITVTDNEIAGNNRGNLEATGACSGCTGGMKLWQTTGAVVSGNNVHDNHGVGIWLDNNNTDARIESNTVRSNDREGIMIETSYNTVIRGNTLSGNAVVAGQQRNDGFPVAAIFVSNSGGAAGLPGPPRIDVSDNHLTDNYNGVVVFIDANRSCASITDSSIGHCTLTGGTQARCADSLATIGGAEAFIAACHWRSGNVTVHDNTFTATPAFSASCTGACNRNATIATTAASTVTVRRTDGSTATVANPAGPTWAQASVADPAVNAFSANTYSGSWRFNSGSTASLRTFAQWQALGQDV